MIRSPGEKLQRNTNKQGSYTGPTYRILVRPAPSESGELGKVNKGPAGVANYCQ